MSPQPARSSTSSADYILVKDAAQLAGRSISWVRLHRRFGPLAPAELDGKHAVTRASLLDLMRASRRFALPKPRLVVDNT